MKFAPVSAFLLLALASCAVGPDYEKPETALPADWNAQSQAAADAKAAIDQEWWKNFNDPVLTQLIDKAASQNFDLKIAEARIAAARAGVSLTDAAFLPQGDVKGSATREANQMAFPDEKGSTLGQSLHKPFNIFTAGFDASWEIDLFGGIRRGEERAAAQLQASEASRDDVRVSLMAEVARTYIDIRAAQAQVKIAQDTVAADRKTLDIAGQRVKAGIAPGLDVTQAEAALQQAQTQLPVMRDRLAQDEYDMDVLLGEQPGATQKIITSDAPIPTSNKQVALAAPASVIAQRPDIRVAERNLAAATAQQGVAVAQFFPKISLSGFFGALNTSATGLISPANESWLASGGILWPILNYGTLSANLDTANAQQQEAMASYQKTILGSLSDVNKSLSSYTEEQKFLQSALTAVVKDAEAAGIARQRYKQGLTSFIEVLDAERTLYTAQKQATDAEAMTSQNLVALYKSLGGGWQSNASGNQ
ncbi:MAG: efflux transporter outer membrane subunit [Alphaproteobacteria bacterium]|nr:efflux transporter outer membrane subunit [Alphaproteobacteria bacterium]